MPDFIKIKIRRGTSADWANSNPVLADGEIAVDTEKHGLKVGNGSSTWSNLPFCSPEIVNDLLTGGTDATLSAEQGKVIWNEVVNKADKTDLTTLQTNLINIINSNAVVVEDNLTSYSRVNALSANQGRVLWEKVNSLGTGGDGPEVVNDLTSGGADKALSAQQGVVLKGMVDAKADATEITRLEKEIQNIIVSGGVEIVDSLNDPSPNKALSANKGFELNEKIKSMSIFGMGYTVNEFNAYGKPTKITFEDGVTATLTWIAGIRLATIKASTGETITIDYNDDGLITGRTITRGA